MRSLTTALACALLLACGGDEIYDCPEDPGEVLTFWNCDMVRCEEGECWRSYGQRCTHESAEEVRAIYEEHCAKTGCTVEECWVRENLTPCTCPPPG